MILRSRAVGDQRALIVFESVRAIKPTTNPYLIQLVEALRLVPGVTVRLFSFRTAIFCRYDLYHVHWPEVNFGGHRRSGRIYRRVLTTIFLVRLAIARTPVVRTWHNLERPQDLSRYDHFLLDCFDRLTTLRIGLNESAQFPDDGKLAVVIRHGHYCEWYGGLPQFDRIYGRIAYAGAIRRYKGVEDLVAAFAALSDPSLTLRIAGRPSSNELSDRLTRLACGDPRMSFSFQFLDDREFVREITEAELIVLPYRRMHNSGIALACLSLGRPILMPDNEVNRDLAREIGPGWLYFFDDQVTAESLRQAIGKLRSQPPQAPPDLSRRDWSAAGIDHLEAFRAAIDASRHKREPLGEK